MKRRSLELFNEVYSHTEMYYGWDLRQEFTDFVKNIDLMSKTALDIGCGEGRYSLFLSERGCSTTALDASSIGLDKVAFFARRRGLQITTLLCDLEDYNFPKENFDIIVAATVLDHLDDVLMQRVVSGIKSSLKDRGFLYANVFTVFDPGYEARIRGCAVSSNHGVSDTAVCIEHYFEPDELCLLFNDLETLYYYEGIEPDLTHGTPHEHGWASIIARKMK